MAHIPVLLDEVLGYLRPHDGETYVDCTFGSGGYSREILKKANAVVYAIDVDPEVQDFVSSLKSELAGRGENLHFIRGNFANLAQLLGQLNVSLVDGIIADLGISSMQIDRGYRGFSFQKEGPLDMRMSKEGDSAYDVVNTYTKEELQHIIYKYGEESKAKQIAWAIVNFRKFDAINSTLQLSEIVNSVFKGQKRKKIDHATKTFQAIRIWVNGEIRNLKKLLEASVSLLKEGGRLIVVSFHSLEDRVVKEFMKRNSKAESVSRYVPEAKSSKLPVFRLLTKKAIFPSDTEVENNVRSRSARLRAAIKVNIGGTNA